MLLLKNNIIYLFNQKILLFIVIFAKYNNKLLTSIKK